MVASIEFTPDYLALDVTQMHLTDEQFQQLCVANPDLRIEMSPTGKLIIMPPAFGETSYQNSDLNTQLGIWNRKYKLGKIFDSSCGYFLANGFKPSPDVSWIANERLAGLSLKQFIPIAPDFAIELRSSSDRLLPLQQKMQAYLENGVRLGWLINPPNKQVEIYRLGQDVEVLQSPTNLSGEAVLPGFVLDLTVIW
ncbi:MAG: Uma2 family endonuclease [Thermosynechococcaceae cyanobacterium]